MEFGCNTPILDGKCGYNTPILDETAVEKQVYLGSIMRIRNRTALKWLEHWREKSTRKPLLIRGARQVGKSSLVKLFAEQYEHFIQLNLELPKDKSLFDGLPPIEELASRLALRAGVERLAGDTLLFIDEIQEAPEAIQQLRYFYEVYPELHVIAAGSLLEFAMGEVKSFPVGRVEFYTLHPLSFTEYLQWIGKEQYADILEAGPVPDYAHPDVLALFHRYTVVGGMPEVVAALADGAELHQLSSLYESIWSSYRADIEKYAKNSQQRAVLRHLITTAVAEDDRIKLAQFGGSNYRSDEVGEAFQALQLAGVLRLIYPTTSLGLPLVPAFKRRPRIQFLDTGLLNYARGIQADLLGVQDLTAIYRGRIAQHIVAQEIIARHHEPSWSPYFWIREKAGSSAEIDLLLVSKSKLYPLEIKSGAVGRLRSLHLFMERTDSAIGIRALQNSYSKEEVTTPSGFGYTLVNLPYYAVRYWESYLG